MLPKPTECIGCPLYQDGKGFVPDRMVEGADVLILAQAPGGDEEAGRRIIGWEPIYATPQPIYEACDPQPLIGRTGLDLREKYLPLARLDPSRVSMANVLKCRWIKNGKRTNDLPSGRVLDGAVSHCVRSHLHIDPRTTLVVAMGALAAKVTGCPGSVTDWRGYTYGLALCGK